MPNPLPSRIPCHRASDSGAAADPHPGHSRDTSASRAFTLLYVLVVGMQRVIDREIGKPPLLAPEHTHLDWLLGLQ